MELTKRQKEVLLKKNGELRSKYHDFIVVEKNYLKTWRKSGRHYTLDNHESYLIDLCRVFKVRYKHFNDSPRGGAESDYIKITKRSAEKLTKIIRTLQNEG